jgi:hypothetical protein
LGHLDNWFFWSCSRTLLKYLLSNNIFVWYISRLEINSQEHTNEGFETSAKAKAFSAKVCDNNWSAPSLVSGGFEKFEKQKSQILPACY